MSWVVVRVWVAVRKGMNIVPTCSVPSQKREKDVTITQKLFLFLIPGHQNCLAGCWTAPQEDIPVEVALKDPKALV